MLYTYVKMCISQTNWNDSVTTEWNRSNAYKCLVITDYYNTILYFLKKETLLLIPDLREPLSWEFMFWCDLRFIHLMSFSEQTYSKLRWHYLYHLVPASCWRQTKTLVLSFQDENLKFKLWVENLKLSAFVVNIRYLFF